MNQNPENKISISLKATYTPLGDVSIRVHNKKREFANFKGAILRFTTDSNTITATKNSLKWGSKPTVNAVGFPIGHAPG